jgi:hypothetical protein
MIDAAMMLLGPVMNDSVKESPNSVALLKVSPLQQRMTLKKIIFTRVSCN